MLLASQPDVSRMSAFSQVIARSLTCASCCSVPLRLGVVSRRSCAFLSCPHPDPLADIQSVVFQAAAARTTDTGETCSLPLPRSSLEVKTTGSVCTCTRYPWTSSLSISPSFLPYRSPTFLPPCQSLFALSLFAPSLCARDVLTLNDENCVNSLARQTERRTDSCETSLGPRRRRRHHSRTLHTHGPPHHHPQEPLQGEGDADSLPVQPAPRATRLDAGDDD